MSASVLAYQRDVFAFLGAMQDESLDGVLTDLPYPTTERHRARGTTTRTKASKASSNPWYGVMTIDELCNVLALLYQKMKKNTYAFVYVDDSTYVLLAAQLGMTKDLDKLSQPGVKTSRAPKDSIGFGWWNPCTWGKTTNDSESLQDWWEKMTAGTGVVPPGAKWNDHRVVKLRGGSGYHPPNGACTERILMLEKGKSNLRFGFNNLFLEPRPKVKPDGATIKAASPKPVRIAHTLTMAMAEPGGVICDPFVGCGNDAVGIVRARCHALVNDVDLSCFRDWMANVYEIPVVER